MTVWSGNHAIDDPQAALRPLTQHIVKDSDSGIKEEPVTAGVDSGVRLEAPLSEHAETRLISFGNSEGCCPVVPSRSSMRSRVSVLRGLSSSCDLGADDHVVGFGRGRVGLESEKSTRFDRSISDKADQSLFLEAYLASAPPCSFALSPTALHSASPLPPPPSSASLLR